MFDDLDFDDVELWFQVHNLLVSKMNGANAAVIGAFVGKFVSHAVGGPKSKL